MMLRKHILKDVPDEFWPLPGAMDIAALATVLVTSEAPEYPIDHAFDGSYGPGGSRWLAAGPGEQRLVLAFDAPQNLRTLCVEIEELDVARTQELQVAVSCDGGQAYRELLRQEYNFSPPGTTFEREVWSLLVDGVTHLRLTMKPDKGGAPCRATLTTVVLQTL